ncbi:GAF domain-containing protein [Saccharothrix longispora]|uniref:GAF domain-containing protein n=1 Tax=Saccharothrix longispora TaxID=33920 RepID=A0ABU1PVA3_9PSEU|nr:GAF domain-containing protein [Saccharothrix longispora]MDR6594575.1 GAF domain-containing protein [Saccharothrix longispora]
MGTFTTPGTPGTPATSSTSSTQETWGVAIRYIVGRKSAEEALGFLAHCGAALSGTVDLDVSLREVARAGVAFLADVSRISLVEGGVPAETVTEHVAGLDPAVVARQLAFLDDGAAGSGDRTPDVLAEGHPVVYAESGGSATEESRSDAAELGVLSALLIPLSVRGRLVGTLTLVRAGARKKTGFGPSDVALAGELGRQVAMAVEVARLHRALAER